MKAIKKILLTCLLVLSTTYSMNLWSWDGTETINHLEEALNALEVNKLDVAEEHMKLARQAVKDIVGGSLEVKAQRGSNLITKARREAQSGNSAAASVTLKEALEIIKGLHGSSESGRGGLN